MPYVPKKPPCELKSCTNPALIGKPLRRTVPRISPVLLKVMFWVAVVVLGSNEPNTTGDWKDWND